MIFIFIIFFLIEKPTKIKSSPVASSSSSSSDVKTKNAERLQRLRDLHLRRNEARKLNHLEVMEEDYRKDLPANYEKRCDNVKNKKNK